MKQSLLLYLFFATSCSYGQNSGQDKISAEAIEKISDTRTTELTWEQYQDSLREEILKRKENIVLKNSFLQEMYIRNLVKVLNDSLFVIIPFNLHGPDCGAPDCYSTDVSFSFKLGDSLIFPEKLQFAEYEHGCIDHEKTLSGNFQLIEQTGKHIIYHSVKEKKTLVLFSTNKHTGTLACYFSEKDKIKITGKNIYKILDEIDESTYPFTGTILIRNEYEHF